jgi:GBP family porin
MKKSLLALAALSTFAGMAHAQSTVTLYGIADAGILYTNNVGTSAKHGALWQVASGNESGSRWGLTGAEDLGGGLKAIFKLENGFNVNNGTLGQGGREFGRQAYVGLEQRLWHLDDGPPIQCDAGLRRAGRCGLGADAICNAPVR